jgi:hypothetical protein
VDAIAGVAVKGGLFFFRSHIKQGGCQLTDVLYQFVIVSPGSKWFDFCHAVIDYFLLKIS